jgi:hypothetical protein
MNYLTVKIILKSDFILSFICGSEFVPSSCFSVVKILAQLHKTPLTLNYTKLYDRNTWVLAFPNAMGLPFVFTLKTPTLLRFSAMSTIRSEPDLARGSNKALVIPESLNISTSMQLV